MPRYKNQSLNKKVCIKKFYCIYCDKNDIIDYERHFLGYTKINKTIIPDKYNKEYLLHIQNVIKKSGNI